MPLNAVPAWHCVCTRVNFDSLPCAHVDMLQPGNSMHACYYMPTCTHHDATAIRAAWLCGATWGSAWTFGQASPAHIITCSNFHKPTSAKRYHPRIAAQRASVYTSVHTFQKLRHSPTGPRPLLKNARPRHYQNSNPGPLVLMRTRAPRICVVQSVQALVYEHGTQEKFGVHGRKFE